MGSEKTQARRNDSVTVILLYRRGDVGTRKLCVMYMLSASLGMPLCLFLLGSLYFGAVRPRTEDELIVGASRTPSR